MSAFKTDLNQRERRKYAASVREMRDAAGDLAEALEAEDDASIVVHLVRVAVFNPTITELMGIMKDQAQVIAAREQLRKGDPFGGST